MPGDPTPPVITPLIFGTSGANGWYVSNVTVNWRIEDPESAILWSTGCDARTLTADTPGTRLTCSAASDGGETTVTITIRRDTTAPTVSAAPARPPDANGWYNRALTVAFSGTDATSGIDVCSAPQGYSGPDRADASVSGTCRDRAGNTTPRSFGFQYDATGPQVTATPSRSADANGWYNHALTVGFTGTDPISGVDVCATPQGYSGPDRADASVSGSCRDRAGNTTPRSFGFQYDATGPQVTATPSRSADANGWFNHALTVAFAGTDATSAIAGCSADRYWGPDNAAASVAGSCSDVAGNVTGAAYSFKYDATAPTLSAVTKKLGNRSVQLAWRPSGDIRLVEILRAPGRNGEGQTVVYRGTATTFLDTGLVVARKYRYRVTGFDEAENRSEHTIDITATGALLSPAPGTQVANPPRLVWTPVKGASYYNVQLIHGRKVLSAWPVRTRFQLRRTWRFNGRRYRLRPGVYRWYVWPGYGRISAARYGRLLGGSTFVVTG